MKIRISSIKTDEQYREYLNEVERILSKDEMTPSEKEDVETLSILIESFEQSRVSISPPDPIDAIEFCMSERKLKQVDLIPYVGTRSRVSEILSRKRPLTVSMIRRLSVGLGIPTEVLVQESRPFNSDLRIDEAKTQYFDTKDTEDGARFPFREIWRRGWLEGLLEPEMNSTNKKNVVLRYLDEAGIFPQEVLFRRTVSGGKVAASSSGAMQAWLARIVYTARQSAAKARPISVVRSGLDADVMKRIARLSAESNGPRKAISELSEIGITVVLELPLRGTSVDGAALLRDSGYPVIGLSLRHDRIDSFWFTLLHELAHVWKHLDRGTVFVDDIELQSNDLCEREANKIARDSFIPRSHWARSAAYRNPSRGSIEETAGKLGISPAIVAGRLRFDGKDFTRFSDMLGPGEIRQLFSGELSS